MKFYITQRGLILPVDPDSIEARFIPESCPRFDHFPTEIEYFGAYPSGAPLEVEIVPPDKDKAQTEASTKQNGRAK